MQAKEMLNGRWRRAAGTRPAADLGLVKAAGKAVPHPYESRHVVVHPRPRRLQCPRRVGGAGLRDGPAQQQHPRADLEGQQVTHRENSPVRLNDKSGRALGEARGTAPGALSPQQALGPEGVKAVATLSPAYGHPDHT